MFELGKSLGVGACWVANSCDDNCTISSKIMLCKAFAQAWAYKLVGCSCAAHEMMLIRKSRY